MASRASIINQQVVHLMSMSSVLILAYDSKVASISQLCLSCHSILLSLERTHVLARITCHDPLLDISSSISEGPGE